MLAFEPLQHTRVHRGVRRSAEFSIALQTAVIHPVSDKGREGLGPSLLLHTVKGLIAVSRKYSQRR
jgi:hypothetical protein